jgi:hypothetical protein
MERAKVADYEDLYDLDNLDDDEIYDLILQQIREFGGIDPDQLDLQVEGGFITVEGRIGTEQELQELEQILTDVLGISNYSNELVIDDLSRVEQSEASDELLVGDERVELTSPLGEGDDRTDPQATHLLEDLPGELYGTHDVQKAIERGEAYEAPDRPVQEGSWSEENH